MLKPGLIAFILLSHLNFAHASETQLNCAKILEQVEYNPTENLFSYFNFLLENKIININDAEKFYQELNDGHLSNPIAHKSTDFGPVFSNSQIRDHYYRFQELISNKEDLNFETLKKLLKAELKSQGLKLEEKTITSKASNFDFYLANFEEIYFNNEISETGLLEKHLNSIAPNSTSLFIKNLENSSNQKQQYLANMLKAMQIDHFDYAKANAALQDLDHQRALTYYFIDDKSKEFTSFVNSFLENYISIIKNKKSHSYYVAEIYKRIKNVKQEYLPHLEYLLLHTYMQSYDYHQLVRLYAQYGEKKQIDFLKGLTKLENLKTRGQLLSIIYSSLLKLGEIDFVIKSIKHNRIYDYYNYEWIFENIEKMPEEQVLNIIKQGLQSSDQKMQYLLADKLALIKSPNALKLKKEMYSILPTTRQLVLKLKMISGLEEDWAIDLIKANLDGANNHIQRAALEALKGGSSKRTRDIIEKIYNDHEVGFFSEQYILGSLEGRPVEDLLYFIRKYKNEEISYVCLKYLSGHYYPEAVELASDNPPITQEEIPYNYLKSIPYELALPAWKKLAKDKYTKEEAIKNLYGSIDDESLAIISATIKDSNPNIQKASYESFAYAYFYFLEKYESTDLKEKELAIKTLKKLTGH